MAYSFSISSTGWNGSFEPRAFFADQVVNLPLPLPTQQYMRRALVYTQWRYGQGLQGGSEIGTINTAGFTPVNGPDSFPGGVGRKYRCTRDTVEPDPPGSGIWKHTQTWEYATAWELVDRDTV